MKYEQPNIEIIKVTYDVVCTSQIIYEENPFPDIDDSGL